LRGAGLHGGGGQAEPFRVWRKVGPDTSVVVLLTVLLPLAAILLSCTGPPAGVCIVCTSVQQAAIPVAQHCTVTVVSAGHPWVRHHLLSHSTDV